MSEPRCTEYVHRHGSPSGECGRRASWRVEIATSSGWRSKNVCGVHVRYWDAQGGVIVTPLTEEVAS